MEEDLRVMGVRRWRSVATNRKEGMDTVQQAKAHKGLLEPMEEEEEDDSHKLHCGSYFLW